MALLASHWRQGASCFLDQLLVLPDLLLPLLGICGHLDADRVLEQLDLETNSQQLVPLGPDIKMADHLTASVGGVAKHLGWLQGLGLAKPMAFQEPQDLGHPGVHWLRTIDDGFDLLDQSWRDGHGFDLLAAVGPVLDCCLDCTAGME